LNGFNCVGIDDFPSLTSRLKFCFRSSPLHSSIEPKYLDASATCTHGW
jgi:hypothetical protein